MKQVLGWLLACVVSLWRLTCRFAIYDDPRPQLRQAGRPYVYALLHAHQVGAVFVNDEPRLAAMVSRSDDGALLVPALRLRRVRAVRGSSRAAHRDKGGRAALASLAAWVSAGDPALLAVDGPRGPRNRVHRGVVALARQTNAVILPVLVVAKRRWILRRTWDRLQVPKPFSRIHMVFAEPLEAAGRDDETLRQGVANALAELEVQYDFEEAERNHATPHAAA